MNNTLIILLILIFLILHFCQNENFHNGFGRNRRPMYRRWWFGMPWWRWRGWRRTPYLRNTNWWGGYPFHRSRLYRRHY